jgi:hypothetical protein
MNLSTLLANWLLSGYIWYKNINSTQYTPLLIIGCFSDDVKPLFGGGQKKRAKIFALLTGQKELEIITNVSFDSGVSSYDVPYEWHAALLIGAVHFLKQTSAFCDRCSKHEL